MRAISKQIKTWLSHTQMRPAAMVLLILTSLSGCKSPGVISADDQLSRLNSGVGFTAPVDGWFMSDALYRRYRRAVADKILELETSKTHR